MRKGTGISIGVGGSSILVIFVLLCLTTFATLSLVSANADMKLTRKTADAATQYYEADTNAEELLARVDSCLKSAADQMNADQMDYLSLCRDNLESVEGLTLENAEGLLMVHYSLPINENRELRVTISVPPFSSKEKSAYTILQWQDVHAGEWEETDSLNLWSGGNLAATPF